jgi:hypothetical protein
MDADVHVGQGRCALPLRLIGVQTPKGYGFFLTNLPARIGPRQAADCYRVRWEVERSLRLDKSVNRLDAIDTERSCTLKTRLQAARMASTLAARPAHTPNGHTRPQQAGAPRAEAPRHPRRLALPLAVSCQSIAQAFDLNGTEAQPRWNKMAEWLTHSGKDPTWRRRPSVLDQRRGWTRQSLTRKQANHGELRHGPVQAAA